MKSKRLILTLVIAGVLVGVLVSARLVLAGSNPSPAGDSSQQPGIANSTCLACHGKPDQTLTLPSGEVLYLTVDQNTYDHSVQQLYTPQEISQGFQIAVDKRGNEIRCPLMALSIGVAHTQFRQFKSAKKMFEVLAQVRQMAQPDNKSVAFIDRRRTDR